MPSSLLPPNVQTERRHDDGSRKVIEHIREIQGHLKAQDVDLGAIKKDLEQFVTYKWLIGVAFGFAVAVGGAAWKMQESALQKIEDNRVAREAAILQIRQETAATSLRVESKIDGVYRYLIEGKPKAEVRAAVQAEERTPPLVPPPPPPKARR